MRERVAEEDLFKDNKKKRKTEDESARSHLADEPSVAISSADVKAAFDAYNATAEKCGLPIAQWLESRGKTLAELRPTEARAAKVSSETAAS